METPAQFPQFKNPTEELEFLRAEVKKRESFLSNEGIPISHETAAKEILASYESVENKKDLEHPDTAWPVKEQEAFVLRLSPEPHDSVMEELLGVLLAKGIKNALTTASSFHSPHIDDDFHRLLVQYLGQNKNIPGLKEKTPLAQALQMRLFQITLPDKDPNENRTWRELLSAMEQFYAGMQSIGDGRDNQQKFNFSIEIALSNDTNEVIFYVAVPYNKVDLLEKQLLAIHTRAQLTEKFDDYNVFNTDGESVGAYATLSEYDVFPLKTEGFEYDPLNVILNVFSKLEQEGEGAAIQIIIRPEGGNFISRFHHMLEEAKDGKKMKNIYSPVISEIGMVTKELFFGSKDKEKKVNEDAVRNIGEKIKSSILPATIRVIASAKSEERAKHILQDLQSAFHQFTDTSSNSIEFKEEQKKNLEEFFHAYSYRLFSDYHTLPLNLKELATLCHFPFAIADQSQLKTTQTVVAPAPIEMSEPKNSKDAVLLGINNYRGRQTRAFMKREDRMRHFYVIGQTGTGKTNILKNMIIQDIRNGDGVCFIDPHGNDVQDILSKIPPERIDDVIYFDPAYTARPVGLNMLEYDVRYPEQKTFVVNELLAIFNKIFDMKTAGGPAFEQYFRNSALLVMEDPASGNTLLEISRVMSDKAFRDLKLSHCKNPIISQFWENAEKTSGEQSLSNFVPYITNKFDVFISNDIMRPVIAQEKSAFNFREIMDNKKILLVNLAKGRLGEINAGLIGLILVGKMQMAALSRVDMFGKEMSDFFLYIDEFQNITTDSISSILSEARKYRLSLTIAHQYIDQLEEGIKNAVFGNVGSMAVFRISSEDATQLESRFTPTFVARDIMRIENYNAFANVLINGSPAKPFSIKVLAPEEGNMEIVEKLKELSYLRYGRDRAEVEEEIIGRYMAGK